jgi:uncharacterized membrane protein YhaH (DUF805 family)
MSDDLERPEKRGPEPATDAFGRWVAGRARRREYWLWLVPILAASELIGMSQLPWLRLVIAPLLLLAMIRRLHDLGLTGWIAPAINIAANVIGLLLNAAMGEENGSAIAYLLHLAAFITLGSIPGQAGANGFGPPPGRKAVDLEDTFS